MEIKISLILPSLNVVDYIRETIESVKLQSIREIEIICIDAGSTDGTVEIIESAAKDDTRIRLIHSSVRSYGYQVNLGIDVAKGDYIAVVETDDFVDPDMFRRLYDVARANDADYVKADYDAFFTQDDGTHYYFSKHSFHDTNMYDRVLRPRDYGIIGRDDWYLWQGIYSKNFLQRNRIRFNETPGAAFQDIGFLFWTGIFAERAIYLRSILYHYRIDRETASSYLGKGLQFSYTEFYTIKDKLSHMSKVDDKVYHLLFPRMAKSFVSSYCCIDKSVISKEEHKNIYEWFCSELKHALNLGYLTKDEILIGQMDKLDCLLESEEEYLTRYSEKKIDSCVDTHESFVIFGCGDYGYKAYNKLRSNGKTVLSFYDNNSMLWGKTFNGILINNPEKITDINKDCIVIIANETYFNEIEQQIMKLGIQKERIIVLNS